MGLAQRRCNEENRLAVRTRQQETIRPAYSLRLSEGSKRSLAAESSHHIAGLAISCVAPSCAFAQAVDENGPQNSKVDAALKTPGLRSELGS